LAHPKVDDALLRRVAARLPPHELARASRAADADTLAQRLLARALVRTALARYAAGANPFKARSGGAAAPHARAHDRPRRGRRSGGLVAAADGPEVPCGG
jgi:hypothetical protein